MLTERVCLVCGDKATRLGGHLHKKHSDISDKGYYDLYLNENDAHICPTCGGENHFISLTQGYRKHCSTRCSSLNDLTKEKVKKTNLDRYGVEWNIASDNNRMKSLETIIDRYGVTHQMKNKDIKEKISKTNLERYGAENVFASKEIKEKIKVTNTERYGVEYASQNDRIKSKIFETKLERYNDGNYVNIEQVQKTKIEKYGNKNHNNGVKQRETRENLKNTLEEKYDCTLLDTLKNLYGVRWYTKGLFECLVFPEDSRMNFIKNEDIPKIEEYLNATRQLSIFQKEITDFITLVLGMNAKNSDVNKILINDRKSISPYELDIYIPHMKLAIECDGVYWHSINNGLTKDYHSNKTEKCEDVGIRLIHITDWEWNNKKEICQSIIRSALNYPLETIDAKNCHVKEISTYMANDFFDKNHLQGSKDSALNYGLFSNEVLVQVISINDSDGVNEIVRTCSILDTEIIDGFAKLLDFQPFGELFCYIDKSKFTGVEFLNNGFFPDGTTEENYSYYKRNLKVSNNKIKLKDVIIDYDDDLTEFENMSNNSWLQVYDCGNLILKYRKEV